MLLKFKKNWLFGDWATRNSSLQLTQHWRLSTDCWCFVKLSRISKAEWPGRSSNRSLRNSAFSLTFNFTSICFWIVYEPKTVGCWRLKSWVVELNFELGNWTTKTRAENFSLFRRRCDPERSAVVLISSEITETAKIEIQNHFDSLLTLFGVKLKLTSDGWPLNALKSWAEIRKLSSRSERQQSRETFRFLVNNQF